MEVEELPDGVEAIFYLPTLTTQQPPAKQPPPPNQP
jgi:hypothetical protein